MVGTDRAVAIQEVARVAFQPGQLPPGLEPGLYETGTFSPPAATFPNGCHVCELEIDEATGAVTLVSFSGRRSRRSAQACRRAGPGPSETLAGRRDHSLSAPASSPRTRYRRSSSTMPAGGALARIAAAATSPQGTSKTPGKSASATGTVRLASVAVKV